MNPETVVLAGNAAAHIVLTLTNVFARAANIGAPAVSVIELI
ncbi:hypothetical protein NQ117_03705 [Paenibacillus sp. SC116]|nr:hypothetical protein [Paenibacillus sp. SC116]